MKTEEFLSHFGILGMKWGKRSSKKTQTGSDDHNKKLNLSTKKLHEMSNTELKMLNERLQLEKQYKELINTTKGKNGKKIVTDLLVNAAKQTASVYIAKYMGVGVDSLIKKLKN